MIFGAAQPLNPHGEEARSAVSNHAGLRSLRHCERSEAIHLSVHEVTMDCFASLAMTTVVS
jgi:hypothetical protein